jgi:hypothetical protein
MSDPKVGDRVSFLRMSNKAVKLTGTIKNFLEDGKLAEIAVDGIEGHVEHASVADMTPLETPAENAAQSGATSYTTVNGKAI